MNHYMTNPLRVTGTVDVITFVVKAIVGDQVYIEEAAPGDGDCCGSAFLNRRLKEMAARQLSRSSRMAEEHLGRRRGEVRNPYQGSIRWRD